MPRRRTPVPPEVVACSKRIAPQALALMDPRVIADWTRIGILSTEEQGAGTRQEPAKLVLKLDFEVLEHHRSMPGERVSREAALWLYTVRAELEREGVRAPAAWCVSCGAACVDRRVQVGHVGRVRQWCYRCVAKRHRSERRPCAAADCIEWFWTSRANQLFCSDACSEADRRAAT